MASKFLNLIKRGSRTPLSNKKKKKMDDIIHLCMIKKIVLDKFK